MNILGGLFASGPFMPHGHCYLWTRSLIALHTTSDALIVLAYYSIPLTLVYFARRRRDLAFHWMFVCFALFILACGTTHLMEIWNIWHANYWLAGTIKAITALSSVPTAILLMKLVPQAIALPSPRALQEAYGQLERRVAERTAQLSAANERLVREVNERQRAEQESRESEARLRAVLDSALSAVVIIDAGGKIADWNAPAEMMFGWTRAEAIGRDLAEAIIPPRHRDNHRRGMRHFLATGEGPALNRLIELSALRRDGSEFPAELFISPLRSAATTTFCGFITDITQRKQAELASVRLAAIVTSSDDAIIGKSLEGVVTSWNAGAEKIFGYSAEEMVGHSIRRLMPLERREEENRILEKVGRGESVLHFETVRQTKDGRLIEVSITTSPVRDLRGTIVGASKIARDITESKKAEGRLKESLRETGDLKAALDEHAIVAITDPRGRITYVNDKFCAISQYSREELIGQDHRLINSGHHSKEFIRGLWAAITHGRVWKGEIKNRAKDGSFYWVDTTIVPFLDESGRPRQYIAIRADITERKLAEEAVRESQQLLRAIIDNSIAVVYVKDLGGRYLLVNRRYEEIFRLRSDQILGKTDHDLFPRDMADAFRAIDQKVLSSGKLLEAEEIAPHHDGPHTYISIKCPLIDAGGKAYAVCGISTDITDRKEAEEQIRRLNNDLERRVAERTAQLETANRELEAFSYSVSHDLRAPLRGVDGYIRMLKEDCADRLDTEGNRLLDVVSSEAKRMGQLIDDLLTFSRLGRQHMGRTAIDMTALASEVFERATQAAPGQPPATRFELKPLPPAEGDFAMLKQVFANLVGNALKYSRNHPSPVVEVGGSSREGETTYYVKDNGVGFDEKHGHKLFGVFQRLHSEKEFEGTGVGLALVQRIVHRHGGKVWAHGKPGEGATFYFTLPAPKKIKT